MDFDNPKVYGDTSITDGLVIIITIAEEATGVIMISTQDQSHSFHSDLEYNSRFTLRISYASLGLGP